MAHTTIQPADRPADIHRLNGMRKAPAPAPARSEEEDRRLRRVAQDFETIFLSYMMKTMRETVPESGLMESNLDREFFTGMFDEEVSKRAAQGRGVGLAEMIYRQLSGQSGLPDVSGVRLPPFLPPVPPPLSAQPSGASAPGQTALERVEHYRDLIDRAAEHYGVDARLIRSVMLHESGGRNEVRSSKGAKGLMQLMDPTARDMGVQDVYDPAQNIMGGTRYLRYLLDRHDGNLELALASYNAGPGAVDRFGGVPPFKETRQYVNRVMHTLNTLREG
jgi:soluble lytic murein transglycosylase-like protein